MSGLHSIRLAIDVATKKRDQLSKELAEIQKTMLFSQGQLEQLQTYSGDTDARWTSVARVCATPELMRHHYQFMDRLHHAMGLQQGVLSDLLRRTEVARKVLLDAEFRLNGLKRILATRQAETMAGQVRREQKQADEFAAMQFRRVMSENQLENPHEH